MMKKFGIILLSIAFLLSAFSLLPVKKAVCHTEDRPMLMAAEPWDYYHNPNGSNHNPGSSTLQDPTDNQKTIQQSTQPTTPSQDSIRQKNSQEERNFRDLLFKISLYLRILFR